uniref:NB-ARC domain-containing protein n=1 Tax=Fagus sylvatica TaxID=28930 RepID=A0A2N9G4S3_FAGSY
MPSQLHPEVEEAYKRFLKWYVCILDEGITVHKLGLEIADIMTKISNLKTIFQAYGIKESILRGGGLSSLNERQREQRQTYSGHLEHDVVGFEDDLNKLVGVFAERRGKAIELRSICGMGGLGKTTLAKMVYNHDKVKQHFECRAWAISQRILRYQQRNWFECGWQKVLYFSTKGGRDRYNGGCWRTIFTGASAEVHGSGGENQLTWKDQETSARGAMILVHGRNFCISLGKPKIGKLFSKSPMIRSMEESASGILTLDLRYWNEDVRVPNVFKKMEQLRHLYLPKDYKVYEKLELGPSKGRIWFVLKEDFLSFNLLSFLNLYDLEEWRVEEGAMPSLCRLQIESCPSLRRIPDGLRFVTTLQELEIKDMRKTFKDRVDKGGEDFCKVQHVPSLVFQHCDKELIINS